MTLGISVKLGETRPGSTLSGDIPQCNLPLYWLKNALVIPTETLLSMTTTEPCLAYSTTDDMAAIRWVASTELSLCRVVGTEMRKCVPFANFVTSVVSVTFGNFLKSGVMWSILFWETSNPMALKTFPKPERRCSPTYPTPMTHTTMSRLDTMSMGGGIVSPACSSVTLKRLIRFLKF